MNVMHCIDTFLNTFAWNWTEIVATSIINEHIDCFGLMHNHMFHSWLSQNALQHGNILTSNSFACSLLLTELVVFVGIRDSLECIDWAGFDYFLWTAVWFYTRAAAAYLPASLRNPSAHTQPVTFDNPHPSRWPLFAVLVTFTSYYSGACYITECTQVWRSCLHDKWWMICASLCPVG